MKRILLSRLSALGDTIMALPTLLALKTKYPKAAIDWLAEPAAAAFLKDVPQIDRVIVSPRPILNKQLKAFELSGLWTLSKNFYQELRAERYDAALDLHGLLKSSLPLAFSRATRKIGYNITKELAGLFLNERIPHLTEERHHSERNLNLVATLGADHRTLPPFPWYLPSPEAQRQGDTILKERGLLGQKLLALNPGASQPKRRWPTGHWQALIKLLSESDFHLIITGGPDDTPVGEILASTDPKRVSNLCGRTTVPALAAVLARSHGIVTGDTGPMHVANAMNLGGVAIFGPTKVTNTGPNNGRFTIASPPLDCLGCHQGHFCPKPCLSELTPQTVYEATMSYLAQL